MADDPSPEDLLDIHEAARLLRVSETSLRRWTDSGRLACLRVGRRRERRFRRGDLLAFLERQPADAPAPPAFPPVSIAGLEVAAGAHLAAFYTSDAGRTRLAVAFLAEALRPGSAAIVLAQRRARDAILHELEPDPGRRRQHEADGRLILGEYASTVDDQLELWERTLVLAMRAGAQTVRVVGDVSGLAREVSRRALIEYEVQYEQRVARRFPVVTMCQYDARRFTGADIVEALRGHGDTFAYPIHRLVG